MTRYVPSSKGSRPNSDGRQTPKLRWWVVIRNVLIALTLLLAGSTLPLVVHATQRYARPAKPPHADVASPVATSSMPVPTTQPPASTTSTTQPRRQPATTEPTATTRPWPPTTLRLPFRLRGTGPVDLPPFTAGGRWTLDWAYACPESALISSFGLDVEPEGGSLYKSGTSQHGTEQYSSGTHAIAVQAGEGCTWSLAGSGRAGQATRVAPFTLTGTGAAVSAPFRVSGGWNVAWSYRCSGNALVGYLDVEVKPGFSPSIANDGSQGAGSQHFDTGGTYFFDINRILGEGCHWTLHVTD